MTAPETLARPRRHLSSVLIVVGAVISGAGLLGILLGFHLYSIPSASNVPTFLVGDVVLGSRWPYGFSRYAFSADLGFRGRILGHAPKRGDMVVFKLPRDPSVDYVKRVIGLPDETVQMKGGRMFINGAVVAREPVASVEAEGFDGRTARVPTYREILPNGSSYPIIQVQGDGGFQANTDEFKVPPGHCFVMGDNRDNSLDSRISADQGGVGYVPLDNIVARVEVVLYSTKRPDRLMTRVP